MTSHLSTLDLENFVIGLHDSIDLSQLREHLKACQECSQRLQAQATSELAIRDLADSSTFCVACDRVMQELRCEHCGAVSQAGSYQIEALIVQNSRGRMYIARGVDGKRVALKELAFVQAPSSDDVATFEREASILKTLSHPGIPRFVANFREGEGIHTRLYLAQEYIEGECLETRMEGQQFSEGEALQVAEQCLGILVYLQSLSPMVFHRDIKPANLMRREDGRVVLVDFGAARSLGATSSATLVGTFGYMPVEQLGGIIDATSDVYALGASLCHLLTRRDPWQLMEDRKLLDRMNVSPGLRSVITKMVAPGRIGRYPTAQATLDALRAPAQPAHAPKARTGFGARPLALGLAAASLLTFGGAGFYLMQSSHEEPARPSFVAMDRSEATLSPAPASVIVNSVPANAQVLLDGRDIGRTPLQLGNLEPGEYTMKIQLRGYNAVFRSFRTHPGEVIKHTVKLIPMDQGAEFQRIAGSANIHPPPDLAVAMMRRGEDVEAKLSVCVTESGAIASASIEQSSGYTRYDDLLRETVLTTWRYEPRPLQDCTSVTFIYKPAASRARVSSPPLYEACDETDPLCGL